MLRIHLDSTLKTIVLIWSFLVACLLGCDSPDSTPPKPRPTPKGMAGKIKEKSQIDLGSSIVVLKTEKGDIEIELFAKIAPKTVANFASKIGGKLYDNTSFHRVEKESLIQASSRFQALETVSLDFLGEKGQNVLYYLFNFHGAPCECVIGKLSRGSLYQTIPSL